MKQLNEDLKSLSRFLAGRTVVFDNGEEGVFVEVRFDYTRSQPVANGYDVFANLTVVYEVGRELKDYEKYLLYPLRRYRDFAKVKDIKCQ